MSAHGVSVHVTTLYMASPYILSLFKVNNNITRLAAKCNETKLNPCTNDGNSKVHNDEKSIMKFSKTKSNNPLKQFNLMFMIQNQSTLSMVIDSPVTSAVQSLCIIILKICWFSGCSSRPPNSTVLHWICRSICSEVEGWVSTPLSLLVTLYLELVI